MSGLGGDCLRYTWRNFLFKSFISLGYVTAHTGLASASLSDVYAPFPKPSILFVSVTLRVWEVALLLGSSWLGLMVACFMGA